MNIEKLKSTAKSISYITRLEKFLLYQTVSDAEAALKNGRAITAFEDDMLAGFIMWDNHGDWLESHTLYVLPEFRKAGVFERLANEAKMFLYQNPQKKFFFFSRVPVVAASAVRFGFVRVPYSHLSFSVWLSILARRLSPARLLTYLKHGTKLWAAASAQLYVLE